MTTLTRPVRAPRGPRSGRRPSTLVGTPLRGILPLLVLLGLWQLFGNPDSPYYPPPSEWVGAVRALAVDGQLGGALAWTASSFALGLLLASVIGTAIGVLVGGNKTADRALGPGIEFLRVLPASALVPIAALLLGFNLPMKLVIVIGPTMWPILLSCRTGRKAISPVMLDVPRTLGLSRWEGISKVVFPSVLLSALNGIRIAAPLCLIITLLVEILTKVPGLGALIAHAQANFQSAAVYGLLVVAGCIALLINWIVTKLTSLFTRRLSGSPVS